MCNALFFLSFHFPTKKRSKSVFPFFVRIVGRCWNLFREYVNYNFGKMMIVIMILNLKKIKGETNLNPFVFNLSSRFIKYFQCSSIIESQHSYFNNRNIACFFDKIFRKCQSYFFCS